MRSKESTVSEVVETYRSLVHAVVRATVPAWLALDLTVAQLKTLIVLAEEGPVSIGQVAAALDIGLSAASYLVDRLVQAELANRHEDPSDRRRTLADLSPKGRDLVGRLRHGGPEHLRTWVRLLGEDDLNALLCGLKALALVTQQQQDLEAVDLTAGENPQPASSTEI
ncbi:MAG: MarR family transcriptional regulator [Ardenticatenaceae bacterium]|nr:MarR family transcriptional regulator [Ardenticatenaceae bacterium]